MTNAERTFTELGPNFMTPEILAFIDSPTGKMIEVSQGDFLGNAIYGVSVIDPDGSRNDELSRAFDSVAEAILHAETIA